MTNVFCFLLSALSLVWVLVIISPQSYRPLMLLIGVWAIFRAYPTRGRWGPAIDTLWVVGALVGLYWPVANGEAFWYRTANPTGGDVLSGTVAIIVILGAARRTTGWILPISAAAFLVYAFAGPWFAAIGATGIAHRGYDLPRLVGNLYMTLEGIYGVPLDVAVTYIVLFSLYGAVLEASGAGKFFVDFSMSLFSRGHPVRAAGRSVTLAGFLLGSVSGSGVATTVTLGSVAWPVLRRVGVGAEPAGAMLAAAGIGALLSPPTLGAAAFLIAEYLRISYLQVLLMATIPTILYYISILLMIEGERVAPVPEFRGSEVPGFSPDVPAPEPRNPGTPEPRNQYFHFTSLVLVAVLMVMGLTPFRAVFWATIAAVALSFLGRRDDWLVPKRLGRALVAGGRDVLPVLATTAVAGIIVGVVTLTGIGLKAAGLIVGLAGGSLVWTVVFGAIAVWILGLAVPVTASYIISAVMVVPALDHRRRAGGRGTHVHLLLRRALGGQSADCARALRCGRADRRPAVPHDDADVEVHAAGIRRAVRIHARRARSGIAPPGSLDGHRAHDAHGPARDRGTRTRISRGRIDGQRRPRPCPLPDGRVRPDSSGAGGRRRGAHHCDIRLRNA